MASDEVVHKDCGGRIFIAYARSFDCGDYVEYEVELECEKCGKVIERNNY